MSGTLRGPGAARTVLLRMAADEARAGRIRQLKADHPDMTWGYIGDQVGVRERSAIAWQKDGGISPENAKKLAEVFGVSYEWLWFGDEHKQTPDLMQTVNGNVEHVGTTVQDIRAEFRGRVDRLDLQLAEIVAALKAIKLDVDAQNRNLKQQTELLTLLPAIQRVLDALPAAEAEGPPAGLPAPGTVEAPGEAGEGSRQVG